MLVPHCAFGKTPTCCSIDFGGGVVWRFLAWPDNRQEVAFLFSGCAGVAGRNLLRFRVQGYFYTGGRGEAVARVGGWTARDATRPRRLRFYNDSAKVVAWDKERVEVAGYQRLLKVRVTITPSCLDRELSASIIISILFVFPAVMAMLIPSTDLGGALWRYTFIAWTRSYGRCIRTRPKLADRRGYRPVQHRPDESGYVLWPGDAERLRDVSVTHRKPYATHGGRHSSY